MSKRERNWRPALLSLEDIQYDLRIGSTKFAEWVARGWMPQPWIKEGGVTRWRTSEILDAIDTFPNHAELNAEMAQHLRIASGPVMNGNPWADQRAK